MRPLYVKLTLRHFTLSRQHQFTIGRHSTTSSLADITPLHVKQILHHYTLGRYYAISR